MKKVLYKNRLGVSILLLLTACICCFTACSKEKRDFIELGTPTEIKIENDMLEWTAIENAESYLIDIDQIKYTTETNNLDVFSIMNEARTYEIKIKAIGNQTYLSSALSLKNSGYIDKYTSLGKTVNMSVERNIKILAYNSHNNLMEFKYAKEVKQ